MLLARIRARRAGPRLEPEDLGEPPHVDVAPAQHHRDLVARRSDLAREQRRDADRAAALDDLLLVPVAVRHRRGDLVLAHQKDLVDQITHQREGVAVVEADAAAQGVGEARLLHHVDRPPGAQALVHRSAPLHGDADHPDRRIGALQRERDAADQAAAGQRHQHGVEIGQVLEQLEADRPLPGDDLGSSNGETKTLRCSLASRLASASAASWPSPSIRTSAPCARTASTLFSGTSVDMKTVAGTLSLLAAWATARA